MVTAIAAAVDVESSAERLDAVDQAAQAGAGGGISAALSVVGRLDEPFCGKR